MIFFNEIDKIKIIQDNARASKVLSIKANTFQTFIVDIILIF